MTIVPHVTLPMSLVLGQCETYSVHLACSLHPRQSIGQDVGSKKKNNGQAVIMKENKKGNAEAIIKKKKLLRFGITFVALYRLARLRPMRRSVQARNTEKEINHVVVCRAH